MSSTTKETKESPVKERKRRRPLKPESESTTGTAPATSSTRSVVSANMSEADKAKHSRAVFYYEENEVEKRKPDKDLALHKAACDELVKVMADMDEVKKSDAADKAAQIERLKLHGTLQFVTLRKLNRMAHFRCKKARDKTNEEKQRIDQQNLRLQNLLYEVMHLQKEITKCFDFQSKDEDIALVSVAEFYKSAPDKISRPDTTTNDGHQQKLGRLEWELEQRKRLSSQLKEAQSNKDIIAEETTVKKDYLESLQPKLSTILQATKPVQEYLGMPFDEIREQQTTATYLPQPLYVLYMQSSAYKDACDQYITVTIQGDLDVAKSMESTTMDLEDDSDSDNEEQDKPREQKRRRRTTADNKMTEKKARILKKHPLSIQIVIKCKDGSVLQLTFYYLVALKIATVAVKLIPGANTVMGSIAGGDLLSSDLLLNCLYPGDTGDTTPNPSNNFALKMHGLGEFSDYLQEVGRPYHWVQWLCGLQFLSGTESTSARSQLSLSQGYMEGSMKRLRKRIKARLSLQKQLASLERGHVPVLSEYQDLFPAKISTRLVSWKRLVYDDLQLPHTQHLVKSQLAQESDMIFIGNMERGSAKVTAHMVVSQDYPDVAPLFVVNVNWKKERNHINDENIKELEAEVNIHHSELVNPRSHDQLLTNQVQRLLMCLDVYLETESEASNQQGPAEIAKEKIFPRLARGPCRSKPYKYNAHLGFFLHR